MDREPRRIVIIGGVAAGATAAARLRRLDETADITLIEKGPYVSFANCGLPYHISGAIPKRSKLLLQTPEGFFSRYRVTVRLHTEALAIDRGKKTVLIRDLKGEDEKASEERLPYDALILAQGGNPIVPQLPGVDLPQVFKLWTIPDMDGIQKCLKEKKPSTAVVVGGGFIGLEIAEALIERGISVTLVELTDHLMPAMDPLYGARIKERLEIAGTRVLTKHGVTEITEDSVLLDDGSRIEAELVLLSVGVRPNVDLASAAGLELGSSGALAVDEYLRTKDPFIWAAGDMVEVVSKVSGAGLRIPLAGPANRQGRIAATNVIAALAAETGESDPKALRYTGAAGTSVVKIMDETAAFTGFSLSAARRAGFDAAEATVLKGSHASYYPGAQDLLLTLVYDKKDGRLLGAEAYGVEGVEKRIDTVAVALQAKLGVADLAEMDFAYAPPYSSANDPLNIASFVASNGMSGYSPLISAPDAALEIQKDACILDLRTYGEYIKGHIKDSIHLPLDEIRDRIDEIPTSKPLYLLSNGGFEGHIGCRILIQRGFKWIANISGGWAALRLVDGLEIVE